MDSFFEQIVKKKKGFSEWAVILATLLLALLVLLTALCNTLLSQVMAPSWALIASTLICAFVGTFFVELDSDTPEEVSHES